MNLFKYFKSKKRIKYPKKYKRVDPVKVYTHDGLARIVKMQYNIKERTGKYYTVTECADLVILSDNNIDKALEYLV